MLEKEKLVFMFGERWDWSRKTGKWS